MRIENFVRVELSTNGSSTVNFKMNKWKISPILYGTNKLLFHCQNLSLVKVFHCKPYFKKRLIFFFTDEPIKSLYAVNRFVLELIPSCHLFKTPVTSQILDCSAKFLMQSC